MSKSLFGRRRSQAPLDTPGAEPSVSSKDSEQTEVSKTEAPKTEAPRTETPRTEGQKSEGQKTEAPKTEVQQAGIQQIEDRSGAGRNLMLRFGHVEIFVTDVKRAKDFYVDVLGLDLVDTQDDQFVWLRAGEVELLLRPGQPPNAALTYREAASAVVLYTHNLATTKERLEMRGLRFLGTDGSPGCLTFQDPEGNWLQLVNPEDH